jgi:malic enzyme
MDSSSDQKEELRQQLRSAALEYHQFPRPGKISVTPTKGVLNQRDLALAYTPGVAAPCEEIVKDPSASYKYTARGNLVAVISNGTAVLGLGNIGPLASKPVMEGKGVLFKKFAAIDVFDIEIAETDPDKLVDIIASLEPTFGGVNLEDIKAPECFYIERLPRRPARYRDHRRRRHPECPEGRGQRHQTMQAGRLRRRRGGPGLPRADARPRLPARKHLCHRPGRRGL